MARKLNLNFGCRGNAGLDGRIQILFSRHEYSIRQGRLSYNIKPLVYCVFSLTEVFEDGSSHKVWSLFIFSTSLLNCSQL